MGFTGWMRREVRPATRWTRRKAKRVYSRVRKHVRTVWSKGAGKYKNSIKDKWNSKFKGKIPTKEEQNEFIETVSEELTPKQATKKI